MNLELKNFIQFGQKKANLDAILEYIGDGLTIQDRNFKIIYQNDVLRRSLGDQVGNYCYKAYNKSDSVCENCVVQKTFKDGKIHRAEISVSRGDGTKIIVENTASSLKDDLGQIVGAVEVVRDITERKNLQKKVENINKSLEDNVKERTTELENLNMALKVLLEKREEDRKKINENIYASYNSLVKPFLQQLGNTIKRDAQIELLDIIEKTVKEVISPFSNKMLDPMIQLTPSEILVARLIKEGKTTKEIAPMLNKSLRVVSMHRENIRQKLHLTNSKINLRSYLLSI